MPAVAGEQAIAGVLRVYGEERFAQMTDYGKYELYKQYGGGDTARLYYEMYNILGDPSLDIWTDYPETISANYAGTVPAGATSFDITVTSAGSPIEDALVCIAKDDDGVYETAYTNASGAASITMSPAPLMPGAMAVTVLVTGADPGRQG